MQWFDGETATWIGKLLPGTAGSAIALLWMPGQWPRKLAMFLSGAALSYFATPWLAGWTGTTEGPAGFVAGLFGMAVIDKIFKTWDAFDATGLFGELLRKWLGLTPAKPQPPADDTNA